MVIRQVERRLERLVEGGFARIFRSTLRPVEIGRRVCRALDDGRTVGVDGAVLAPNRLTVTVSPDDDARFAGVRDTLERELGEAARDHARDRGYRFLGPVTVTVAAQPKRRAGTFEVNADYLTAADGAGFGSVVLDDGTRVALSGHSLIIGRLPEADLTLPGANTSRRHAELRPADRTWMILDLGSTNGTRVNGATISEHRLVDGDRIEIGDHRLTFEAS